MNTLAKIIIKFRWVIVVLVAIITVFLGLQIKDLKIDADALNTLPENDSVARLYKDIGNQYGGSFLAMIVVETDDIFTAEVLEHIHQITDTLKYMDGVSTVSSLTDIIDIKNVDDMIEVGKLVDAYDLPKNKTELETLRNYIRNKELYDDVIVSEDATASLIMVTLEEECNKQLVAEKIQRKIEALGLPEKLYFGGLPMMVGEVSKSMQTDLSWLMPIVFVLIVFILFLSFRSAQGVVLPLLTAIIALIWTLGTMVLTGYDLTIVSNAIPIILLAIGSAYTIHVINKINQTQGANSRQTIITALEYVAIPVVLSGITTAIGFVSFIFGAYLTTIIDFGIFASVGTLFAMLLSIFFVPSVIAIFSIDKKAPRQTDNPRKRDAMTKYILQPIINMLIKRPETVISIWILAIVLSVTGMFFINANVNMQEYFSVDHPTRLAERVLQDKFSGSQPVFVRFKGDMQSPETLKMMVKTAEYMKEDPNISKTNSVADLIQEMNNVMGEGKIIPDDKSKIQQLWFLLEGQDIMPQLVNDDLNEGIIQSIFISSKSRDMADFLDYMAMFINENFTRNYKIELSGVPSVYVTMLTSLIKSQFSSLFIAICLVLVIVASILKSLRNGIYATIPIIATVFILFGIMGLLNIALDIATVLVASVALGIGIDYSIHIINHFNYQLNICGNLKQSIQETILVSGKAITINVLSVSAGFLVFLLSEMIPLQNFGLLVTISMLSAGLGALTLLPAVLIIKKRNLVKSIKN